MRSSHNLIKSIKKIYRLLSKNKAQLTRQTYKQYLNVSLESCGSTSNYMTGYFEFEVAAQPVKPNSSSSSERANTKHDYSSSRFATLPFVRGALFNFPLFFFIGSNPWTRRDMFYLQLVWVSSKKQVKGHKTKLLKPHFIPSSSHACFLMKLIMKEMPYCLANSSLSCILSHNFTRLYPSIYNP